MQVHKDQQLGPFHLKELIAGLGIAVCFVLLVTSILAPRAGTATYNALVGHRVLYGIAVLASLVFIVGRGRHPLKAATTLAFGCLAAILMAAALNSPAIKLSLSRLGMYYSFAAFCLVLSYTLAQPSRSTVAKLLLAIAMVHAPFLAVALYAATLHDPNLPFVPPFFSNVRHLGYLGFVGAAASLAVVILDQRLRLVGMFLTGYALFGLLALGSRGAIISWGLSAAAFALMSGQRHRIMWIAAGCFGGAVALAYLTESASVFKVIGIFDRDVLTEGIATVSVGRPAVWLESWQHFIVQPILGYGPEGFAIAGVTQGLFAQPHNFVLQILLESGLLGLVAALAFGWILFAKRMQAVALSIREGRLDDDEAALLSILAGFFAFALIDGVFYHAIPLLCFVILLSAWIAISAPTEHHALSAGPSEMAVHEPTTDQRQDHQGKTRHQ